MICRTVSGKEATILIRRTTFFSPDVTPRPGHRIRIVATAGTALRSFVSCHAPDSELTWLEVFSRSAGRFACVDILPWSQSIVNRSPLGQSPLQVSALGLGTWAMGGTVEEWGPVDDRESIAAIHQALDLGINLIDTAPVYGLGHAEEIVGKAIRSRRDDIVLVTQCGLLFSKSTRALPTRCLARESIIRQCEESLRRLRTDVIDLYQCHWPDPNTNIRESMEALTTLLEQGKIRAIGLSNFGCERLAVAREFGPVHCVQLRFSLFNQQAKDDLLPDCMEHQTGVLAYGPLAKGLLTGTLGTKDAFEGVRARDPDFVGSRYRRNLETVDALRRMADGYEKTVAQLAINWVAGRPGITAPIFGAKRPSQVAENVGAIGWTITEDDLARIDLLIGGLGVDT